MPCRNRVVSPVDSFATLMKQWETSTVFPGFLERTGVIDPRDLAPEAFTQRALALGVGPEIVRRLLSAILARGSPRPGRLGTRLPGPAATDDAIGNLPRLDLERSVVSRTDGFQKLRFRTADGLAVETVIIPLHKPGAVSVCLSSQVGCAWAASSVPRPGCPAGAISRPGRSSTSSSRPATLPGARAGDVHRGGVHGDGRAVSELRPCARRGRAPPLPVRRIDRRQGDHDQHGGTGAGDRPVSRTRDTSTGSPSAWARRPTPSGPGWCRWPPARRWPRSWPRPAVMPWRGGTGSCWPTSASRARTWARTMPGPWVS